MPAIRKESFIINDPKHPKYLICEICSKWLDPDTAPVTKSFKSTSKSSHLTSGRHKDAVRRMEQHEINLNAGLNTNISDQSWQPEPLDLPAFDPGLLRTGAGQDITLTKEKHSVLMDYGFHGGSVVRLSTGEKVEFSMGGDSDFDKYEEEDINNILNCLQQEDTRTQTRVTDSDSESLNNSNLGDLEPDIEDLFPHMECDSDDWHPYGSKTMFMLDYLDNLPRMRLSDDQLKSVIWVMRECGTPNVPTFSKLRATQERIMKTTGIQPVLHSSAMENNFYTNHPAKLLSLDWSNPRVRPLLRLYPEIGVSVREYWQAEKWTKESNADLDTPMWADWDSPSCSWQQYFVDELARTVDYEYVLLERWLMISGVMSVMIKPVTWDETTQTFTVTTDESRAIPARELRQNINSIRKQYPSIPFCPNKLRDIGKGRPIFRIRVMVWSDDVSGNQSKQYNAHTNTCLVNLNIPHCVSAQESFVRFCSTSQHASSSEQITALVDDFDLGKWHTAYDCLLQTDVCFQIYPHVWPGDNPQQSETSSHIGVRGKFNSRRDMYGGTEKEKEEPELYIKLHTAVTKGSSDASKLRTSKETVESIKHQIRLACTGNQKAVQDAISSTGVKDKIALHWITHLLAKFKRLKDDRIVQPGIRAIAQKKEIEKNIEQELWSWVIGQTRGSSTGSIGADLRPGDHYNALLEQTGVNIHEDTPVEILHTYLLGNDKYVWYETWSNWKVKDVDEETFKHRLQSAVADGLSISLPRAQYIVQYKNNLIGKHFRALQQLALFQLYDLVDEKIIALWRTTGDLGAVLWFPEIYNMDEYLSDLQILVDNLLDAWGAYDPRRIISKVKLRLLPYLIEDIRRFGPAILFQTELFESYNGVFRLSSIHSNHHAPSHDIARDLGRLESFRHIVSGGWWIDSAGHKKQAGPHVRAVFDSPDTQRRLGWNAPANLTPGDIMMPSSAKREVRTLTGARICNELGISGIDATEISAHDWLTCEAVVAQSRDLCKINSWVFFRQRDGNQSIGRIMRILQWRTRSSSWVVIRPYNVDQNKDAFFGMPILTPSPVGIVLVQPMDVTFLFNAQHDCRTAQCRVSLNSGAMHRQERLPTTIPNAVVVHAPLDRYLVNLHALHNAHLIRQALPRSLTAPIPLHEAREEARGRLAAKVQSRGNAKRSATKAKAEHTRNLKKLLHSMKEGESIMLEEEAGEAAPEVDEN